MDSFELSPDTFEPGMLTRPDHSPYHIPPEETYSHSKERQDPDDFLAAPPPPRQTVPAAAPVQPRPKSPDTVQGTRQQPRQGNTTQGRNNAQRAASYQQNVAAPPVKAERTPWINAKAIHTALKLFTGSRMIKFIGIILTVLSGYLLISGISYFSNGASDQSVVLHQSIEQTVASPGSVGNIGGPVGAKLSHKLLSEMFGIASFILIYYIGAVGVTLVGWHRFKFWKLSFRCFMSTVALSILSGFITYGMVTSFSMGGSHGYYINKLLFDHVGIWGAVGVNIILVSAVILIFLSELQSLYAIYRRRRDAYNEKMEKKRAEIEARRVKARQELARVEAERRAKEEAERFFSKPVEPPTMNIGNDDTLVEESAVSEAALIEEASQPVEIENKELTNTVEHHENAGNNVSVPEADNSDEVVMTVQTTEIETIENTEENSVSESRPLDPRDQPLYDPMAELSHYKFPPLDLLHEGDLKSNVVDIEEQENNKKQIISALKSYGIEISSISATVGPTITLYEIVPAQGVRIVQIKRLEDDIALTLRAVGIRIIPRIPGKGTVGIEVPNNDPQIVPMRAILASKKFHECNDELPMAVGATISNDVFIADLAKMPHLLVAGATGQGKSVGLNAILASLLYKKHPTELKLVLVDPKQLEFSLYAQIERHYLAKLPDEEKAIITDMTKVVPTLNSLCLEMENRYTMLTEAGVRNIKEYNQLFREHRLNPEKGHHFLPYIVVVIDEFADLIMTQGKEVENPISRIAAKARAAGIHMILATQRPSTNIITGVIKANFPGRMAFRVTQMVDSRTIIDRPGANQLIGRGDMLFSRDGVIDRVQCAFIDTDEVKAICSHVASQVGPEEAYILPEVTMAPDGQSAGLERVNDRDPLFKEAARAIVDSGIGSASHLQRKFNIGYPRAGKLIDQLEAAGIVGPPQGGKPRQVVMDSISLERFLDNLQ